MVSAVQSGNNFTFLPMKGLLRWRGSASIPVSDAIEQIAKVLRVSTTDVSQQLAKLARNSLSGSAALGSEAAAFNKAKWTDPRQDHEAWQHNLDDPDVIWDQGLGRLIDEGVKGVNSLAGIRPESAVGQFTRGFVGSGAKIFDPFAQVKFVASAVNDPLGVPGSIWDSITPLWSSTNADGSPVTSRQRGAAAFGLAQMLAPLIAHGVPAAIERLPSTQRQVALRARVEELGFDPRQADKVARWMETDEGKGFVERFEKGRRKGPNGSYDFFDPKTGVRFKNGYSVFNSQKTVWIEPTGNRAHDIDAANAAAGFVDTPQDHMWHHSERYGRMELVHEATHADTRHTGGWSIWGRKR